MFGADGSWRRALGAMLLGASVLLSGVGPGVASEGPPPPAPSQTEHEQLYERAEAHRKAGRFLQAGMDYDRAHAFKPSVVLIYNAGRMYQKAGKLELAAARYRSFLTHEKAPGPRRARVVQELAVIERTLADREAERIAALAAAKVGDAQLMRDREALRLEARTLRTTGFAVIGVGAALVVAGIVAAGVGEARAVELANPPRLETGEIEWPPSEVNRRIAEINDTRLAAAISGGAGGAFLLAGLVLHLVASDRADAASTLTRVSVGPMGAEGARLTVQGRF